MRIYRYVFVSKSFVIRFWIVSRGRHTVYPQTYPVDSTSGHQRIGRLVGGETHCMYACTRRRSQQTVRLTTRIGQLSDETHCMYACTRRRRQQTARLDTSSIRYAQYVCMQQQGEICFHSLDQSVRLTRINIFWSAISSHYQLMGVQYHECLYILWPVRPIRIRDIN